MKLHISVVESILQDCKNYGGHASEKKLRDVLSAKRYSLYTGEREEPVLVDHYRLLNELSTRNRSGSVVPMSFHQSAFEKIMYFFDLYSGYDTEARLRKELTNMDFTVYERKINGNDSVLVLTSDYIKMLRPTPTAI